MKKPIYNPQILSMVKVEPPHRHKMSTVVLEKIWLVDADGARTGYDIVHFKKCNCGFKEPFRTERTKL